MEYLELILNPFTTWILIILIILCVILLIIFRKSLFKWLMWFYITTMTVALTFIFISFFADKIISSLLTENVREYQSLVKPFLNSLSDSLRIYGIVLFILSIIAYIVHLMYKNKTEIEKKANI